MSPIRSTPPGNDVPPADKHRNAAPTRQARLAAALRENLRRRKAQARGRQAQDTTADPQDGADPVRAKDPPTGDA